MSDANSQLLNFVCPKCQKKLRAPANLAGQKLACPKCSAPIRVPGVVEAKKDDDEWLSLGEPSQLEKSNPLPKVPSKNSPLKESQEKASAARPSVAKPVTDKLPAKTSAKAVGSLAEQPKSREVDDSDDLLLAPPENIESKYRPKAPDSTESAPKTLPPKTSAGRSVFDDDLPELAPIDESVTPVRNESSILGDALANSDSRSQPSGRAGAKLDLALPDVPLPELSLETPALVGGMSPLDDEEFTFPCKVCGSRLSSSRSRVGSSTSCPDCHTKIKVPPLPKKAKQVEVNMDTDVARVTFAPVDSLSIRDPRHSAAKTKEILDRAEQTLEDERDEFLDGTFDTKRWMGLLFGFLRDPKVIAAAAVSGFATGLWLFSIAAIGTLIPLEGVQALIAKLVLLCLFSIPIALFICMCGIAILAMTANQSTRVTEWPFSKISDSLSECAMVFVSIFMASIPGGMIGVVLNSLNAHPMVSLSFVLIGVWALTPLLLLSMIDNSAIFEPYSKAVWLSIKSHSEAWGAMYMQTGMAFGMFVVFLLITSMQSPIGDFFAGMLLPLACFFQFSQYGVLAGRISNVTEMGFEGDFSGD